MPALRLPTIDGRSTSTPRNDRLLSPAIVGPVKLLVLQGTAFCNIACKYCYLPNRSATEQMTVETVAAVIRRLKEDRLAHGPLLVNWHAGEPTVLRPKFYTDRIPLFAALADEGVSVTHSLQTNGTLIDDDFCDLFKRYDIKIGISVDGPAFLHDARRVTRNGKPTHSAVVAGMRRLLDHQIPFNVICVLTDVSLQHAEEMYVWLRTAGVRAVAFNLEEIEGANLHSSILNAEFDQHYRTFLEKFWRLVEADHGALRVREFDDLESRILDDRPRRNSQAEPFVNISVATDGTFSTFCPELLGTSFPGSGYPDFSLGSVHRGSFLESIGSPLFQKLWPEITRGVDLCRDECSYFEVCGGGNPANKIAENGSFVSAQTRNCTSRIMSTADFMLDKLERRGAAVQLEQESRP